MEWVNITAKSLPEAIDLALDNLGVDEAEAEIEVLEEPRQGLFGRTRGNARVKARVKPKASRPKVERGRNRKRRDSGGDSNRDRSSGGNNRGGKNRSNDRGNRGKDAKDGRDQNDGAKNGEKSSARQPAKGDGRGSGGGGRKQSSGKKNEGGRSERSDRQGKARQEQPAAEEATMEEVSAHLETFLSGLTDAFGFEGPVSINSDDDNGLIGMVEGRHGLMVGPKGRTLDAIQELARVSAQRSTPSSIRIKIDVGGYREMRKEALQGFAAEAAAAALADGKERSLEPMTSADRKIVHDALGEIDGVETRSAGTEPRRRVVVVPVSTAADDGQAAEDQDADDQDAGDQNGVDQADAPADEVVEVDLESAIGDDVGADLSDESQAVGE